MNISTHDHLIVIANDFSSFLYFSHIVSLPDQICCKSVPLRYNYDKPEKPRISRVFGYLARFFILFQTEKSSREVVIS